MDSKKLKSYIKFDAENSTEREAAMARLNKVEFTPLEGQVAFIKELVKFPEEADEFIKNPKDYAVAHGILIDPAIVQKVSEQVLYDVALDVDFADAAGPHITKDIVDLRNRLKFGGLKPVGSGANPMAITVTAAGVVAAAAVVVAVAAVVEAVVTVVRTSKAADLVSLQGLGEQGTILPRGNAFQDRSGLAGGTVLPNVMRGGFRRN